MTILCACSRPVSAARKIADGVGQCPCGRKWWRMPFAEYTDLMQQCAQVDRWNRAMRTNKSRRKFILTGHV